MVVEAKVVTEYYFPKIASLLSILGSTILLAEIYKDTRTRQGASAVSRCLVSMSLGDILFSLGWLVGSWATPRYLDDPVWAGTNHGTDLTCAMQGFVVQFGGLASILFNASLAVCFYLMIQRDWDEPRLRKLVAKVTVVLWAICLGVAFLPVFLGLYHSAGPICWIKAPRDNYLGCPEGIAFTEGCAPELLKAAFQLFPIWICILLDSVVMLQIYRKTRRIEQKSAQQQSTRLDSASGRTALQRFSSTTTGTGGNNQQSGEEPDPEEDQGERSSGTTTVRSQPQQHQPPSSIVAREGMWYITGFLLTFGLSSVSVIVFLATGTWNETLDRASYFFLALQGLWNFMVFSRGRRRMKTKTGRLARKLFWNRYNVLVCFGSCFNPKDSPMDGAYETEEEAIRAAPNPSPDDSPNNNNNQLIARVPRRQRHPAFYERQVRTTIPRVHDSWIERGWTGRMLLGWRNNNSREDNHNPEAIISELTQDNFHSSGTSMEAITSTANNNRGARRESTGECPPLQPARAELLSVEEEEGEDPLGRGRPCTSTEVGQKKKHYAPSKPPRVLESEGKQPSVAKPSRGVG